MGWVVIYLERLFRYCMDLLDSFVFDYTVIPASPERFSMWGVICGLAVVDICFTFIWSIVLKRYKNTRGEL